MSPGEPHAIRWREKLSTLARLSHIPARARLWSYLIVHDRCVSPCHSISHAASSRKKLQRWCKLQTAEAGGQTNSRWTCTGTLDMPLALMDVTSFAALLACIQPRTQRVGGDLRYGLLDNTHIVGVAAGLPTSPHLTPLHPTYRSRCLPLSVTSKTFY
jgi:hypothetical protein